MQFLQSANFAGSFHALYDLPQNCSPTYNCALWCLHAIHLLETSAVYISPQNPSPTSLCAVLAGRNCLYSKCSVSCQCGYWSLGNQHARTCYWYIITNTNTNKDTNTVTNKDTNTNVSCLCGYWSWGNQGARTCYWYIITCQPQCKNHLHSKLHSALHCNVKHFTELHSFVCPNCKIYLFKLQNLFVQN